MYVGMNEYGSKSNKEEIVTENTARNKDKSKITASPTAKLH
jgi:hypothetical protein